MQMKFQVTENIVFLFFFWKASKFILKLCFWKLCLQCGSVDRTEKKTYGNDNRYPVCYLARSYQSKHVFPRSTQLLPVYGAYPAVCEWMKSVQERFVQLKIIFVIRQTHKKRRKKQQKNAVMVKGYWDDHRQVCLWYSLHMLPQVVLYVDPF